MRRLRVGTIVALAVAVGFAAWLFVSRRDDSSSGAGPTTTITTTTTTPAPTQSPPGTVGATAKPVGPIAVTSSGLTTLAKALGTPIYWAGPKAGFTYELTQTTAGKVYVRYLPKGVKVRDPRASFLIVVTYPFPEAFVALKNVSKGREVKIPGGGIALVDTGYPKSVHVAYPGVAYQIEVYDPSPKRSRQVALSGKVRPVS